MHDMEWWRGLLRLMMVEHMQVIHGEVTLITQTQCIHIRVRVHIGKQIRKTIQILCQQWCDQLVCGCQPKFILPNYSQMYVSQTFTRWRGRKRMNHNINNNIYISSSKPSFSSGMTFQGTLPKRAKWVL